jgi:predicted lipid-binding transport protein (Tim44 family)
VWISYGLFYEVYFGPRIGQASALNFGLSVGLGIGLLAGTVFGLVFGGIACLRHLTLRVLLALRREAPWRYIRFLDEMAERLFLYKSGGSYIFIHPLLLDHFAGADYKPLTEKADAARKRDYKPADCDLGFGSAAGTPQ